MRHSDHSWSKLLLVTILFPVLIFGQGVTTSSMRGYVTGADGSGLEGANVIATHLPSGTVYGAAAAEGGIYTILNMRVGGPYTVQVSFIGYQMVEQQDIFLSLGTPERLDFTLATAAVEGEAVEVVSERHKVLSSERTGAVPVI